MSEFKKLITEARSWLDAFDIITNGEDSQVLNIAKEIAGSKKELQAEKEKVELLKASLELIKEQFQDSRMEHFQMVINSIVILEEALEKLKEMED